MEVEPEAAAGGAAVDGDALHGPPEIDARNQQHQHADARPRDDLLAGVGAVADQQAQVQLMDVGQEILAAGADAEDVAGVRVDGDDSAPGGDGGGNIRV